VNFGFSPAARILAPLLRDHRANVAVMSGLMLLPMVYLVGAGVDYTMAVTRQEQLDAIADAAALAGVTPAMMASNDAASTNAATNAFAGQADSIQGVTSPTANVSVTNSLTARTLTVKYSALSQNVFPLILGSETIAISGTSQAIGSLAPNIDFYIMVDDSPSMAIAATQSDINTMVNNTQSQGGCAFGCHESHPSGENPPLGNPNGEDNYRLARNLGVTLRIDLVRTAVQDLTTTAVTTEQQNGVSYRMALYTFDTQLNTLGTLTSQLNTIQADAANIALQIVYSNNWLTSSNQNNDTDTNFDTAATSINGIMPTPGNGTNAPGDKPQGVLFLVTDGVNDAKNPPTCSQPMTGYRCQEPFNLAQCTAIKNRGIRIAVLYTTYLPLPTNQWYNSWISPFQSNIGTTLQNCASNGLYDEVQTGGDISAALIALFQKAVLTSHLSQ
jgi:Flp pilus assembly protein TadG